MDKDKEGGDEVGGGEVKEFAGEDEVAGRGDGQEFGDAFDDRKKDGLEIGHIN